MPLRMRSLLPDTPTGNFISVGTFTAGAGCAGCEDNTAGFIFPAGEDFLIWWEERNSCGWKMNKVHAAKPKTRISARARKYERLPAGPRWEEARAASGTAVTTGDGEGGIGRKTGEGCTAGFCPGFSPEEIRSSPAGGTFSLI